jgi:zinc finger BED domain-containing protein 1 (E3 SUMO-protein ligase ZBED1)
VGRHQRNLVTIYYSQQLCNGDEEDAISVDHLPDGNQAEQECAAKGKKRQRSSVWKFFTKLPKGKAQCPKCSVLLSASSTTTLKYHLLELHKIDCDASESQDKKKKTETQSTLQSYGIVAKSSKKQSVRITAEIAKMIVMDMHPPYMVQHDGFQEFVKFAFPGYELPHRTTFSRTHIRNLYNSIKESVKKELRELDSLCITTDLWTDRYKQNGYMSVTAHFIDKEWEMKSRVLSTRVLNCSHTGSPVIASAASDTSDPVERN